MVLPDLLGFTYSSFYPISFGVVSYHSLYLYDFTFRLTYSKIFTVIEPSKSNATWRKEVDQFVLFSAAEVGTVLTIITANDVDTNPALTYSFVSEDDKDIYSTFSIDRFSGRVVLKKALDFETRKEYKLNIVASDSDHTAHTVLTIRVTDVNDNAPVFLQPFYHVTLPGKFSKSKQMKQN